jgi:D-serine deaminase-like pyridoxal phosphate-dependent protein
MIDNEQQIQILDDFSRATPGLKPWPVFIKIDVGSKRAGVVANSPYLRSLLQTVKQSDYVSLHGFYCHAGHSYSCRTPEEAVEVLHAEVNGAIEATQQGSSDLEPLIISVGATPTAHVIQSLKALIPKHMELELHAGM